MPSKIFILFLLCVSLFACRTDRRTPFKISAKVKNLNGTRVSLKQFGIAYDNDVVENDSFSLSGNLTSMEICEVVFSGNEYKDREGRAMKWGHDVSVFVEAGATYTLSANSEEDILKNTYQIESTSVHQKIYANYNNQDQKARKIIREKLNELDVKVSASLGNDHLYGIYVDSLRIYEDKLKQSQYNTYRKLMSENPNTYAAIYIASHAYDISTNLLFYEGIYKQLHKEYRDHDYGIAFKQKLDEATDVLDK